MADASSQSRENLFEFEDYTYTKRGGTGSLEPIILTDGHDSHDSGHFPFFNPSGRDRAHYDYVSTEMEVSMGPPQRPSQPESLTTIALRTLRLQALRSPFHQKSEPSKVTLQKSRPIALLRGIIHLTPLSAAMSVIALNAVGVYVGSAISWLPSLQFLAKFAEILMNASIATVVFAYTRHELLNRGIPFGALFSALEVTTLSFLWSLEFWGSLTSPHLSSRRRLVFLAFMVLSILLASGVGPSVAIALIPRQSDFPAGRTYVWMNTTQDELFPANLTAGDIPAECSKSSTLSLVGNECLSSEWPTLAAMLSPLNYGQTWTGLQTPYTQREITVDITTEGTINSVFVTTPQASVAELLQNMAYLWDAAVADYPYTKGNPSRFRSAINVVHTVKSKQPVVMTRCLQNEVGSDPFEFPTRQPSWSTQQGHWATVNYSLPSNVSAMESSYRIRWLDLPPAKFPNASVGAIIQPPQSLEGPLADPRPAACSIYAGWIQTQVNLSRSSEYVQGSTPKGNNVLMWPIDWVLISGEWAAALTPPLSDENTTVDAAFYSTLGENLDTDQENSSHPAYIHEAVLASLVTNGMARNGFLSGILDNPEPDLPNSLPDPMNRRWLSGSGHNIFSINVNTVGSSYKLEIISAIFGIAYTTHGVPIKLALAVLVLYCVYAFSHLFYAASTGISSNSWETIAEVTTLALASKSSDKLHNKTSGITTMDLFRERVRICALADGHLELVFDSDARQGDAIKRIKVNRKY